MYPVTFVSLGPGEAELITVKGLKVLQSVDCVFYPATIVREGNITSRALNILTELEIDEKKLVPFHVPMSKNRALALEAYEKVAKIVQQEYTNNLKIAVVAEGDSGFYSSVHYIADNLEKEGVPVKQIAGIPAFTACGALAGIHIVKQEEELNVVPGIISTPELLDKLENGKVIVIMKVSQCEDAIKECIVKFPDAEYHYFENVGVEDKEFYTLNKDEILNRKIPYFSLMIIRKLNDNE